MRRSVTDVILNEGVDGPLTIASFDDEGGVFLRQYDADGDEEEDLVYLDELMAAKLATAIVEYAGA
jgi:hypothetical protein